MLDSMKHWVAIGGEITGAKGAAATSGALRTLAAAAGNCIPVPATKMEHTIQAKKYTKVQNNTKLSIYRSKNRWPSHVQKNFHFHNKILVLNVKSYDTIQNII